MKRFSLICLLCAALLPVSLWAEAPPQPAVVSAKLNALGVRAIPVDIAPATQHPVQSQRIPDPRERRPFDQGGDVCEDAVLIAELPYCDQGTTAGYGDDYFNCSFSDLQCSDVTYLYIPPVDQDITISTCGSSYNTELTLHEADENCNLTEIWCAESGCGNNRACIHIFAVTAGVRYLIVVDGFNGEDGDYILNVTDSPSCVATPCAPPGMGDNCDNPVLITSLPAAFSGNTSGFTNDFDFCHAQTAAPDVVFVYSPPATHLVNITTCDSTFFNSSIYIFRDGNIFEPIYDCANRSCYSFDNDIHNNAAAYCVLFEHGHEYCIVLDGESAGDFGEFKIVFDTTSVETCSVDLYCALDPLETEPNSDCFAGELDPYVLEFGDTIYGNICAAGDKDYYRVVVLEDRWTGINVRAGENCEQSGTDIGIALASPTDCWETEPCNFCGWVLTCGPETVAVVIEGMGDCFTGAYKAYVDTFPMPPLDECDPIACVDAPVLPCGVPTLVNTCDGCQSPMCATYRNGCSGERRWTGRQKFFRLDIAQPGDYTFDVTTSPEASPNDVQFSVFTDCVLPRTSCVLSQDQNDFFNNVTGPIYEEHGTVQLSAGTYYLHVSVEGGGNCADITATMTCAPCLGPEDLTVYWLTSTTQARLVWTAEAADYRIYSTTEKNNDGDPDGGADPDWILEATVTAPAGQFLWLDANSGPVYKNYTVTRVCE